MGDAVLYAIKDSVGVITLNRPDKLNSINVPFCIDLKQSLQKARDDNQVRSVFITGAGKAFCAGADLSMVEFDEHDKSKVKVDGMTDILEMLGPIARSIYEMPKPVIAAVNGPAIGGGAGIALACDVVFASDSAVFGFVFSLLGLGPDTGTSFVLVRQLGLKRTIEILFAGERIGAGKALELGLINRVVPGQELEQTAWSYALECASGPTWAYSSIKKIVHKGLIFDLDVTLDGEDLIQRKGFRTADFQEGVKAFFEKRKPQFIGK